MATHRVLFLDAAGLTALLWHRNAATPEAEFDGDTDGIAAFAGYIAAHRDSLFYLLTDIAEEGFLLEDIPHVGSRDRIAIVKRKLAQHHYGTQLAVALSQGRRTDGRRDETVLFAALTRPQHLEPWLQALRQEEATLVGIFSVPQLVETLVATADHSVPNCLVITLTRGGLRQTYLERGRLRFSRLTRLADDTAGEAAGVCLAEAGKLHRYLASQSADGEAPHLPVWLYVHPDEFSIFRACCNDTQELRFHYLDLPREARRLDFQAELNDSRCETLLAHLLVRRTPRDQFAPSGDRQRYRLGKLRIGLLAGASGLFFCCLMFAAGQIAAALDLRERTAVLIRQSELDDRSLRAVLASLPPVRLPADDLRLLVGYYEELQRQSSGPSPLFHRLGAALNDFPAVEVDRLNWALLDRKDGTAAQATPTTPVTTADERPSPAAAVEVFAHLHPTLAASDPRGQLAIIDGLVERLRSNPDMQVHILSRPFDTASDKPLRSAADSFGPGAGKFVLRVVMAL